MSPMFIILTVYRPSVIYSIHLLHYGDGDVKGYSPTKKKEPRFP